MTISQLRREKREIKRRIWGYQRTAMSDPSDAVRAEAQFMLELLEIRRQLIDLQLAA